jgi:hypothetical protein
LEVFVERDAGESHIPLGTALLTSLYRLHLIVLFGFFILITVQVVELNVTDAVNCCKNET